MTNPYRDHMDKIQALVKQITRDQMYATRPEDRFAEDPNYGLNFVVASGGEPFDAELDSRLMELMTSLTGSPDPEIVQPAPSPAEETTEEEIEDEPNPEDL